MKKSVCTIASVIFMTSLFSLSSASLPISLTLDNPYQTVQAGVQSRVDFSGTISVLEGYDMSSVTIEFPGTIDGLKNLSDMVWDPGFWSYFQAVQPDQGYQGKIFSITVPASAAPADYFYYEGGWGDSKTLNEIGMSAYKGTDGGTSWQAFGITVRESGETSVPGPAAILPMAIGLAGSALRRRFRK